MSVARVRDDVPGKVTGVADGRGQSHHQMVVDCENQGVAECPHREGQSVEGQVENYQASQMAVAGHSVQLVVAECPLVAAIQEEIRGQRREVAAFPCLEVERAVDPAAVQ